MMRMWDDGDGQGSEPDDYAGYAGQRPHRITGVQAGAILSANSDLFNKAVITARSVCPAMWILRG